MSKTHKIIAIAFLLGVVAFMVKQREREAAKPSATSEPENKTAKRDLRLLSQDYLAVVKNRNRSERRYVQSNRWH